MSGVIFVPSLVDVRTLVVCVVIVFALSSMGVAVSGLGFGIVVCVFVGASGFRGSLARPVVVRVLGGVGRLRGG
ncbi:hypothetical protein [Halosolutus halophilus]|uniref:hypothetical protein n=1 Tax=Halosolutus halophilus TaxID=1552990 RepID=UPI0022351E44|nr:hypothetical protein [Halosolutus halophilus]